MTCRVSSSRCDSAPDCLGWNIITVSLLVSVSLPPRCEAYKFISSLARCNYWKTEQEKEQGPRRAEGHGDCLPGLERLRGVGQLPASVAATSAAPGFRTVCLSKNVIVFDSKKTFSIPTGPCPCFRDQSRRRGRPRSSAGRRRQDRVCVVLKPNPTLSSRTCWGARFYSDLCANSTRTQRRSEPRCPSRARGTREFVIILALVGRVRRDET